MQAGLFTTFTGRIPRSQWWLGVLLTTLTQLGVGFIIGMGIGLAGGTVTPVVSTYIQWVAGIIVFVPSLAFNVKRWHDLNYSGWLAIISSLVFAGVAIAQSIDSSLFIVVSLLATVYGIWAFVLLGCKRGTVRGNRYGLDPLRVPSLETQEGFFGDSEKFPALPSRVAVGLPTLRN